MTYIVLNNSPYYGGGVEQTVDKLLRHFTPQLLGGIALVTCDKNQPSECTYRGLPAYNIKVKKILLLDRLFQFSQLLYGYRAAKFLLKRLKPGDIINVHGIEYCLFFVWWRSRLPRGVRVIMTIHGSLFEEYSDYVVKNLPWRWFAVKSWFYFFRFAFYWLEKYIVGHGGELIFMTKHLEEYFRHQYHFANKFISISYGVDPRPNLSDKSQLPSPAGPQTALIVGSASLRKGLDIALEVMKSAEQAQANLKLRVVGFKEYILPISRKGWPSNVDYVGLVDPKEMDKEYDKSDFLLFPSRFESFGLVVVESLIRGKPVIVSDTCCRAPVDYRSAGYVLNDYCVENWWKAVQEMLVAENYRALCLGAQSIDLSIIEWQKMALKYENFLVS